MHLSIILALLPAFALAAPQPQKRDAVGDAAAARQQLDAACNSGSAAAASLADLTIGNSQSAIIEGDSQLKEGCDRAMRALDDIISAASGGGETFQEGEDSLADQFGR